MAKQDRRQLIEWSVPSVADFAAKFQQDGVRFVDRDSLFLFAVWNELDPVSLIWIKLLNRISVSEPRELSFFDGVDFDRTIPAELAQFLIGHLQAARRCAVL